MAVTQGLGDGFALYNGVKLPTLPEWDKETYPYAYIYKNSGYAGGYGLNCSAYPVRTNNGVFWASSGSRYLTFGLNSVGEWEQGATATVPNSGNLFSPEVYPIIWSEFDITDRNDDSIYLSSTSPLPLDGMQVIEWDGDTTGLTTTSGGYAMIADFANAGSAICSVMGGGETAVADDFQKDTVGDGIVWNVKVSGSDFNVVSASSVEYEISGNTIPAGIGIISAGTGTYILAYTPAAEPETPKWQFNLQDFLSGMASAAASRGVLRREPIAYQNMSEEGG